MRLTSMCSLSVKAGLFLGALASYGSFAYAQRPPGPRANEETFRFRFVGPRAGNRVASIAGVPGDPSTYYAGAASGGVWKTTDGGNRWDPDRKSTRLNSSHSQISYAVFCLKKKKKI